MSATAPENPLAAVEVHGVSRQAFLLRGALAAAGTLGAAAVGPWVSRALAQEQATRDPDVAKFALSLEHLEATFYTQALKGVNGLSGETRTLAKALRDNEIEHVSVLGDLVKQLGTTPSPVPKFDFGDAVRNEQSFLGLAQTLEDTGVSAYNGAAPLIREGPVLDAAGRIVQIEARHAAMIRFVRGQDIAPAAFDKPLSAKQVLRITAPYTRG